MASQPGSNDRSLTLIEPEPTERDARQVQHGRHEAGRGMSAQPQQDMADLMGNHMAQDITRVLPSTTSQEVHATDEHPYEPGARDGYSKRGPVRPGTTFRLGREQANVDGELGVDHVSRWIDPRRFFEPEDVPPGDLDADLAVNPGDDGLGFLDHRRRQAGKVLNDDRHVERPVLCGDRHANDRTGYRYRARGFPSNRHVPCLPEPRGLGRQFKEQEWRVKTVKPRRTNENAHLR